MRGREKSRWNTFPCLLHVKELYPIDKFPGWNFNVLFVGFCIPFNTS